MRPDQELYDLSIDSDCVKNLALTRAADVAKLRTQMWAELKAAGDLRAIGRGAEYDAHPSADVKKNRFYERYMGGELLEAGWVKKDDFEKAPLK
jgi:hypothetical protein